MDNQLRSAIQTIKDAFIMHEDGELASTTLLSVVESRIKVLLKEAERRQ